MNTYGYVGGDPVNGTDPSGLRCVVGVGCWTTPLERRFLNTGNYHEYYLVACAGGDKDACFDDSIATDSSVFGSLPTQWVRRHLPNSGCGSTDATLNQIRLDLARDYANYLPQSRAQARWPKANDIAHYHWKEFAKYGMPPSTFLGTPFAPFYSQPVWATLWCPECR